MEGEELGLSLESIVRKAAELEGLLRGCKTRASDGGWSRGAHEEDTSTVINVTKEPSQTSSSW